MEELVGQPATAVVRAVRAGMVSPVELVRAHLERIGAIDATIGAFQLVCADRAVADAAALEGRDDLDALPLAGVPVAIKDSVAVEGLPFRYGSLATPATPSPEDHELVRRLRSAGAIVIGKTRVPELCASPCTDSAFGVSRNPWDLDRTPGGSSGGSAAAVASALVPIAHGSDGGGSVRIPAAACGLVGIKPGTGVIPSAVDGGGWRGLSSDGALATTVDDLALAIAVMSNRPDLAEPVTPNGLRVGWSVEVPAPFHELDPEIERALLGTIEALRAAGHEVFEANPPHDRRLMLAQGLRAAAGIADTVAGLDVRRLERRNRPFVHAGRVIDRLGLIRSKQRDRWRALVGEFFEDLDVLVTPTLAALPIPAEGWSRRSFLANARAASFVPFTGRWNLAGYPAMSVPAGLHPSGLPLAVQLIAPDGGESLILSVAGQLETLRPWPRHAPLGSSISEVRSG